MSNPQSNLVVRNGTVSGWGRNGVGALRADDSRVKGVRASLNGDSGITLGQSASVSRCGALGNGAAGIAILRDGVVDSCHSSNNTTHGISAASGSVVTDCLAAGNDQVGFFGEGDVSPGFDGSTYRACVARNNSREGFRVQSAQIVGCVAVGNSRTGIRVGAASTISASSASKNGGDGAILDSGSTVIGCTAFDNSKGGFLVESADTALSPSSVTASVAARNLLGIRAGAVNECVAWENSSHAIEINPQGKISGCVANDNGDMGIFATRSSITNSVAAQNQQDGILLGGGSTMQGCFSGDNTGDGIRAGGIRCVIRQSLVAGNGNTGIFVVLDQCLIESNHLLYNTRNMQVDSGDNVMVKNSANQVGGYTIVPGNTLGAVHGSIGTASAWDNFQW